MAHCWPELARYLNYEREVLPLLESQLLGGQVVEERFRRWSTDERFLRFLKLQPLLKTLYTEIRKVAAVTATSPSSTTLAPSLAPTSATVSVPEPSRIADDGANLFLRIAPTADGIGNSFSTTFSDYKGDTELSHIQLNVSELRHQLPDVERGQHEVRRRVLADVGNELFRTALPQRLQTLLQTRERGVKHRLLLDLMQDPAGLSSLPWEAVYIADAPLFPVLEGALSMIRYIGQPASPALPVRSGPIRLLAILPNPIDTEPVAEEAVEIFERGNERFASASASAVGPDDRSDDVGRCAVCPEGDAADIFLFFGHARTRTETGEGGILLSDDDGRSNWAGVSSLDTFLYEAGVSLAVLMGADTGSGLEVGLQNSFAGRLVMRGVPAAIGVVRLVSKSSALIFIRSFFPQLFRKGDMEAALAEARRTLAEQGEDWSAYALFSSIHRIETLQFLAAPIA